MTLNLISLANVKTQLGIAVTTYDAALTAIIPIVSSDIRRILNCSYDKYVLAAFSTSSATIDLGINSQLRYDPEYGRSIDVYELGLVVYSPFLLADTYLQSYDPLTGLYTLSATPTGTGSYVYPTVNISMWPAISKMIWYKYSKQNTKSAGARGVASESYGPVSVSYSQNEINKKYDYPQTLIDDLGIPYARVG